MAIHWQVKFRSLRAETLYTVNIYDDTYTGTPVQLTGSERPFETQEDDSDDPFQPVRTQSGYLRIRDTGKDNDGNAFDWRTFIPTTDTDRPVTLTDGDGTVLWMGFMQAQNLGARLYETPQQREFPLQCPLAAMSRNDVNPDMFNGEVNFARLLKYAIDTTAASPVDFDKIIIQGGADAMRWMRCKFDWDVFGGEDIDGNHVSDYTILSALEYMCIYWGWCMRVSGKTLYLSCVDDAAVINDLVLSMSDLNDLANGVAGGTISTAGYTTVPVIDEIANADNEDRQMRGPNTAVVTSSSGDFGGTLIEAYPDVVMKQMFESGFSTPIGGESYSQNSPNVSTWKMDGSGFNGSLCLHRVYNKIEPVVRQTVYSSGGSTVRLRTKRKHHYPNGTFIIKGSVESNDSFSVKGTFSISVNYDEQSVFDVYYWNGSAWVLGLVEIDIPVNSDGYNIPTDGLPITEGFVTITLQGKSSTQPTFEDITEFSITFENEKDFMQYSERQSVHEYKAKNGNVLENQWSKDTVFSTENYSVFSPGLVYDVNGDLFPGWDYTGHAEGGEKPEQHLADRVAAYWSFSRRMIKCNIRLDLLTVTPRNKLTIDGTTLYPLSVKHNWRDDVMKLSAIEM